MNKFDKTVTGIVISMVALCVGLPVALTRIFG